MAEAPKPTRRNTRTIITEKNLVSTEGETETMQSETPRQRNSNKNSILKIKDEEVPLRLASEETKAGEVIEETVEAEVKVDMTRTVPIQNKV